MSFGEWLEWVINGDRGTIPCCPTFQIFSSLNQKMWLLIGFPSLKGPTSQKRTHFLKEHFFAKLNNTFLNRIWIEGWGNLQIPCLKSGPFISWLFDIQPRIKSRNQVRNGIDCHLRLKIFRFVNAKQFCANERLPCFHNYKPHFNIGRIQKWPIIFKSYSLIYLNVSRTWI